MDPDQRVPGVCLMPLTFPYHSSLLVNHAEGDTAIHLSADTAELCAALAAPAHAFATIYTVGKTERVLVTSCGTGADAGKLVVTRGVEGSAARAWPAGACFTIQNIIPGGVCSDPSDDQCSFDITSAICLGTGLRWSTPAAGPPCIELEPTGVVTTSMCGAVVDETGRFTFIPDNWPAVCLPVFDPCCAPSDTGGSETVSAASVSFSPNGGSVTSPNVQGAIEQLDAIVSTLTGGSTGVLSVGAGTGIVLSGTGSAPVVNLSPTGITPNTYAGFTVNAEGRITSYAAPAVAGVVVAGAAPIVSTFNGGTNTYTVSIGTATVDDLGVVRLVDAGDASSTSTHNLIPGDAVVTFDALEAWKMAHGL